MTLYRAVSYDELLEMMWFGVFHPAPPSNMGKWFATSSVDAAEWGRRLIPLGNPPFHLIEAVVGEDVLPELHFDPRCDGIGPGWFVYAELLDRLTFVREVGDVPTRWPSA